MPEDMPAERVYDPDLGRERNALPGEIVKPEEEKTLNRLMREGRQYFQKIYDKVQEANKTTKQFSAEELDIAIRLGEAFAQVQRNEYLDAIRANPINILREAIQAIKLGDIGVSALQRLNKNVDEIISGVQARQVSDKQRSQAVRPTVEYVRDIFKREDTNFTPLCQIEIPYGQVNKALNTLLERLDIIPRADFPALSELARTLGTNYDIQQPSGTAFRDAYQIDRFPLNRPGLEGILVNFSGGQYGIDTIGFGANEQATARIVDAEERTKPQSTQSK